jgi:predicted glycosyltransferase
MDQGKTPQLTSTLVPVSQTAPEAPPAEGASAPQLIARNRRARSRASVRIAFYAHDTLGLGHTRRNLLIATALTRTGYQVDLLIIAGTYAATRFTLPPGADCLALPSLRKDIEGTYTARSLDMSLQEIIHLRSQAIWAALKSFQPDLLVVDNVPRGAAGELDLSLRKLTRRGTTRCVLGLRDVIDAPEVVQAQWEARDDGRAIADHFDRVWIYGDPRLHQTLPPQQREAAGRRVRYLGYFDPLLRLGANATMSDETRAVLDWTSGPFVLAMVGGGQDGYELARAFVRARFGQRRGVLITGPFMHPGARLELRAQAALRGDVMVVDFLSEPVELIPHADRVVSMGGYNSVLEVLACRRPLLVVPRVKPRQEQLIRASRLQELGLLEVLRPEALDPEALGQWLEAPQRQRSDVARLDFKAQQRLPQAVGEVLGRPLVPRRIATAGLEEAV